MLVIDIFKGKTTPVEVARQYDLSVAEVERFFNTLKVESIHGEQLLDRATLRRQLFEFIEMDYNRARRHSALGYISPDAFEAQIVA